MAGKRSWRYYSFDSLPGAHPVIYYRRWRGVTDRLDREHIAWVAVDPLHLSHYLEQGEIGLEETTRDAIESTLGAPLPD